MQSIILLLSALFIWNFTSMLVLGPYCYFIQLLNVIINVQQKMNRLIILHLEGYANENNTKWIINYGYLITLPFKQIPTINKTFNNSLSINLATRLHLFIASNTPSVRFRVLCLSFFFGKTDGSGSRFDIKYPRKD